MMRAMLLAVCLLAGSAQAEGLFGERPEPGQMPSRFIRFEGAAGGMFLTSREIHQPPGYNVRLVTATYVTGPLRFGLALCDAYGTYFKQGRVMLLPVHVGYTLWSNPKPEWELWGVVPDLYVEGSASFWRPYYGLAPSVRVALCCDADYYGLGIGAECGVYSFSLAGSRPGDSRVTGVHAGIRLRFLAFGIGF